MKDELLKYCIDDCKVLLKAVLIFRNIIINKTIGTAASAQALATRSSHASMVSAGAAGPRGPTGSRCHSRSRGFGVWSVYRLDSFQTRGAGCGGLHSLRPEVRGFIPVYLFQFGLFKVRGGVRRSSWCCSSLAPVPLRPLPRARLPALRVVVQRGRLRAAGGHQCGFLSCGLRLRGPGGYV